MSREHFNTGSGEGRDIGIIPPSRGPEPDVMPLDRTRSKSTSAFKIQEEMETSGTTQTEETVVEHETPATGPAQKRKGRGSAQATMGTKDVARHLDNLGKQYSNVIDNARSLSRLSDTDHADLDYAQSQLNNAAASHYKASAEGGRNADLDVVHGHLQDTAASLKTVHKTLKSLGVADKLMQHHIHAAMPADDHVATMVEHANNLPRKGRFGVAKATKPFRKVKMGRADIPGAAISDEWIQKAEQEMGKESYAVRKLKMGRGTQRGAKARLTQQDRFEGVVEAKNAGIAGQTEEDWGAEINPKRRGSGRRVETRFSSDANKLGRTPTFGESGKSGTIKGSTEQPRKRNQGRGGRGGPV